MISNNGSTIHKSKFLSFINKGIMALMFMLLLIILLPCSYIVIAHWATMPILIKLFWPIFLMVILIGVLIAPINGMAISKGGLIIFVPDFRIIKFKVQALDRIVFGFREWENKKYSVMVKIKYRDGSSFEKDYSMQFRNMRNRKLSMAIYTISKRKVDRICGVISLLDFPTIINIIDYEGNIIRQSISET